MGVIKFIVGTAISILLLGSCSSAKKSPVSTPSSQALDRMLTQKEWFVISDWASPLVTTSLNAVVNSGLLPPGNTANNINLIGNPNYVKMVGDSVFADLPFFGERRMSGNYGANSSGIAFEGIPDEMRITKDSLKQRYQIYFEIPDKNNPIENYQVRLTLYPNLNSSLNVNSTHKTPITFNGRIGAIPLKK